MSKKHIFVSVFLILNLINLRIVDARKCYVCWGCTEVEDLQLVTCVRSTTPPGSTLETTSPGSETTTATPATTTVSPGTTNPPVSSPDTTTAITPTTPVLVPQTSDIPIITAAPREDDIKGPPNVILLWNLRQIRNDEDSDPNARCVKTSFTDPESNEVTVVRGCTFVFSEQFDKKAKCRAVIGNDFDGEPKECHVCNEDGCNSAAKAVITILLLVISLTVTKLL